VQDWRLPNYVGQAGLLFATKGRITIIKRRFCDCTQHQLA